MSAHGDQVVVVRWQSRRPRVPVRYPWEIAGEGAAPAEVPGAVVEAPAEPTAAEMAVNFTGAMARWAAAGAPVVFEDVYAQRAAACEACELWDGAARLGLGKCKAPGCGCTKFKRWLATEVCKHPAGSRWPA